MAGEKRVRRFSLFFSGLKLIGLTYTYSNSTTLHTFGRWSILRRTFVASDRYLLEHVEAKHCRFLLNVSMSV